MFLKNTELYDNLKSLHPKALGNVDVLDKFIRHCVGLRVKRQLVRADAPKDIWGGLQAVQYPDELASMLAYMHDKDIKNYLEIGCAHGGTFFTVDSFLRACNPAFEGSLAVDPFPRIEDKGKLKEYQSKFPTALYFKGKSSDLTIDKVWDFVLIDGDHNYTGIKFDFELMKNHAKYIALHDIYLRSGVKTVWSEIKKSYKTVEFQSKDPIFLYPVGMGIAEL